MFSSTCSFLSTPRQTIPNQKACDLCFRNSRICGLLIKDFFPLVSASWIFVCAMKPTESQVSSRETGLKTFWDSSSATSSLKRRQDTFFIRDPSQLGGGSGNIYVPTAMCMWVMQVHFKPAKTSCHKHFSANHKLYN